VTLSTVHRVKGMEWDRVAVFGVNAGVLPHRLAEEIEEERRVLHVAITRCRCSVRLLADKTRPSPFLDELQAAAPATPFGEPTTAAEQPTLAFGSASSVRTARRGRAAPVSPGAAFPEADPLVVDVLRAWRSQRSRHDGVPAFVVMHDRTLLA